MYDYELMLMTTTIIEHDVESLKFQSDLIHLEIENLARNSESHSAATETST
jgi:hypothetical protein